MKDDPCIIVDKEGRYFWHWCASFAPRYDGDEHFVTVPGWHHDPEAAYVFSSYRTAKRALRNMFHQGAIIRYSECFAIGCENCTRYDASSTICPDRCTNAPEGQYPDFKLDVERVERERQVRQIDQSCSMAEDEPLFPGGFF